mgnify:CR=1 FL=1
MEKTTIASTPKTIERLKELGRYGDSLDDIINRLLDFYEHRKQEVAQ